MVSRYKKRTMVTATIIKYFFVLVTMSSAVVFLWICLLNGINITNPFLRRKYSTQECQNKGEHAKYLIFSEHHKCLDILAESPLCQDGLPVPKIVHYILLGKKDFTFFFSLSFLSSYRILKPGYIFVHTDNIPSGKWWDHLLKLVPNIVIINTKKVTHIFDIPVDVVQHQADIMRIQVLLEFGGIYMDTDELALKSFDPLRKYPITMGHCRTDALGVQAIIASKNSAFLQIWYLTYHTFNDKSWAKNSQYMPYKLSVILPELIHVEGIFAFASFKGKVNDIFNKVNDWSKRYGLHLYIRLQTVKKSDPEHIKNLNSTYGQIARFIYYGNKTRITQLRNTESVSLKRKKQQTS